MASDVGSLTLDDLKREMAPFAVALAEISSGDGKIPFEILSVPLSNVSEVWNSEETQYKRLALVP